eukprot:835404_1
MGNKISGIKAAQQKKKLQKRKRSKSLSAPKTKQLWKSKQGKKSMTVQLDPKRSSSSNDSDSRQSHSRLIERMDAHNFSSMSSMASRSSSSTSVNNCTRGFELKEIKLNSTYYSILGGLREYFIEQNTVPLYRFFYSIILDEDNDEIEWRSFVVVHQGDKHAFQIRDCPGALQDPDTKRQIMPSISSLPNLEEIDAQPPGVLTPNSDQESESVPSSVQSLWENKKFPLPVSPDPLPDFSKYLFDCVSGVSEDAQVFSTIGFIFSVYFAQNHRRPAPSTRPNSADALVSFPKVVLHRSELPQSWNFSGDDISQMLFDTSTELNEFATSVLGLEAWELKFTVRILAYVFNPELVRLYAKGASRLVERTNVAESDDTDGRLIVHHPFDLHNLTTPVKRSD